MYSLHILHDPGVESYRDEKLNRTFGFIQGSEALLLPQQRLWATDIFRTGARSLSLLKPVSCLHAPLREKVHMVDHRTSSLEPEGIS